MFSINARQVFIVMCALFSCICFVTIMLKNVLKISIFLKMVVLFIITIFGVYLQVYLQNLLIHNV